MKPAFETSRLAVFVTDRVAVNGAMRQTFLAFSKTSEGLTRVAANAILSDPTESGHRILDWIEVVPDLQRQGYATELCLGLCDRHRLFNTAATEAGNKLLTSLRRQVPHDPRKRGSHLFFLASDCDCCQTPSKID